LNNIKVLDPACGSGAFPIGFMQLMVKTLERLSTVYDARTKKHRPAKNNEKFDPHLAKLSILKNSLYGSDIEPMAIEISKLRAWLSLVIDEKKKIEPLPNLEFNFVCANSLIPLPKQYQTTIFDDNSYDQNLDKLIERYFESHSLKEKQKIREDFNYVYEELSRNDNLGERSKLLKTWNPFKFDKAADFFDSKTMLRVDKFDLVIGNPPYIPLQKINESSKSAYEMLKDKKIYKTYDASGDIYALFYEMGTLSLKENGNLCFITSNKWMRSGYGESLRDFFIDNVQALLLVDLGSGVFESATVDTSILLLKKKNEKITTRAIKLNKDISKSSMSIYIKKNLMDVNFKKNEAWVILSKVDLAIVQKIEKNGKKLGEWPNIKINYGIKTGLNDAFVINEEKRKEIIDNCLTEEERKRTDLILRPLLRGKDINRYSYEWKGLYLIALVPSKHYRIEEFPSIEKHFVDALWSDEVPKGYGKLKLMQDGKEHNINGYIFKSRKPTSNKWFETQDQIAYLEDFNKQKVVYTAVNSEYRFCILEAGYYFNNSIFMISGGNDKALCFVLNSIAVRYYLYLTMGGDNYEYGSKEKFEKIPIPKKIDAISSEEDAASAYGITEAELTYIKDLMSEK
jgi:type I restriction-modification system DNA methylase subunit